MFAHAVLPVDGHEATEPPPLLPPPAQTYGHDWLPKPQELQNLSLPSKGSKSPFHTADDGAAGHAFRHSASEPALQPL